MLTEAVKKVLAENLQANGGKLPFPFTMQLR